MKIYLVRHGQSEANVNENYSGENALTEIGHEQARRVAFFFRDKNISKIYCSDTSRTIETANKISRVTNKNIIYSKKLKEIYGGIPNGRQLMSKGSNVSNPLSFKSEKGESYKDAYKRVSEFTEKFKRETSSNDNVVIVAHGASIILFIISFLSLPLEEIKYIGMKNCSISTIYLDERKNPKDLKINDLTHILSCSPHFKKS